MLEELGLVVEFCYMVEGLRDVVNELVVQVLVGFGGQFGLFFIVIIVAV